MIAFWSCKLQYLVCKSITSSKVTNIGIDVIPFSYNCRENEFLKKTDNKGTSPF